jgi:DEAD/DEAH box helicase domain-containing protein
MKRLSNGPLGVILLPTRAFSYHGTVTKNMIFSICPASRNDLKRLPAGAFWYHTNYKITKAILLPVFVMENGSMSLERLLSAWRAERTVVGNIASWRELPERPAHSLPLPDALHPALAQALRASGIQALYFHQAAAWEQLQKGEHVIVTAGTASGKTLCYNLPILDRLLRDDKARALYLFPTKALTQDQHTALQGLLDHLPNLDGETKKCSSFAPTIYDGDTPTNVRSAIRQNARLLFSNPDMLHLGILPHHTRWAQFLSGLRFIVLDEAHVYRGVFGSHVANVLRRLRRLAAFYGARPQYILTSATLANAQDFAARLIEDPVTLVDDDGAPRGPKDFLIYNPEVIDRALGLRRSALQESVRLAGDLLAYDVQTILFARSRRSVELLLTYLRESAQAPHISSSQVRGYRSGYLPAERRQIEHGLRQGQVRAVVATTALELGIDIGGMGAAVLVGYPGSIAATLQQSGRAGRGSERSLALLVAGADPLDQFLAAHPEYLFERSPEHALINPDNLLILLDHLRCAAFEAPFRVGDHFGSLEPERLVEFLDFLVEQNVLHRTGDKYFWMSDQYPAQIISLRSASASPVLLQTLQDGAVHTIGQVDRASAPWMVHPQAIYLHEGQSYLVESLDFERGVAHLSPVETDYYTVPLQETSVQVIEKAAEEKMQGASKVHGEIMVTSKVVGFQKVNWYMGFTNEILGVEELDMPPTDLLTTGYWMSLDEEAVESLRQEGLWRNDPNDYGPGWPALRERVRRRDGYRCQVCGALEQGRAHDVHHKVPLRAFTSLEEANRLENLITLCPNCHRRAEANVRVRSGLAGLAHVLGHLAPFFLMCDVGDLGVHANPQSPLAEGKPTLVLYDQAPGGIGLSPRLYELHTELLERARQLVSACPCADGCPSCVGPGGENGLGGKRETLAILAKTSGIKTSQVS